jgi:O-succinylbenzoic acid--CoA ligase
MRVTNLQNSEETQSDYSKFLSEWNNNVSFVAQQTSGSTGEPKNIAIEKSKMLASAKMTGEFLGLAKKKNALLCISPNFIGGKMMIVRALVYDLAIITAPISANPLEHVNEKIGFAAMVPLQLQTILEECPEKLDLIDTIIVGGAPVSAQLKEKIPQGKTAIYSTFGMTETISHVALCPLHEKSEIFSAIGNATFSITDDDRLVIHAPDLGIHELVTNDVIQLINSTSFVWLGRADFVINSGGVKIHPEKVEEALRPFIQSDFIITGIPDDKLGEKVLLITEQSIDLAQLEQAVVLPKYHFPKVSTRGKIYYTANNKVDRNTTKQHITF